MAVIGLASELSSQKGVQFLYVNFWPKRLPMGLLALQEDNSKLLTSSHLKMPTSLSNEVVHSRVHSQRKGRQCCAVYGLGRGILMGSVTSCYGETWGLRLSQRS